MKNAIIVLMGIIIALIIVGGALALNTTSSDDNQTEDTSTSVIEDAEDTVKNATFAEDKDTSSHDSDIVKEEVKFNYQDGEGYYREVTYRDGGFRQFDVDTDELIGSSYDSDQDKLPSME
ncbi:MAG: flagellar protein, FliL [Methanobrevibacter sp.]|nr:flagellar protein, FliL [Methanobrevibacter sp.]